ncbi:LacI family DNA-binding transcriptional regulator [Chitinimonas koreensis]|uniref:LacI family DNA-binding transcriptional regulator n=1 Tax=Chitinimonas koreensis TaxID=356302 RepID=UPI00041A0DBF|nr:LacI family DNA-binding transcriptional regulator [Chitinimonas koreensis]
MSDTQATLIDVAKRAGVSLVTASRALNGTGAVAEKTLAKVQTAAAELGYSPNLTARVLKGGRSNVLGLTVSYLQSPFVAEVVNAVSETVERLGLDLIIYNTTSRLGTPARVNIGRLLGGLCDGLLLVLPGAVDGAIKQFEQGRLPVVLFNYWFDDTSLPTVRGDNYHGARAAIRHLVELGHRRIAFIGGSSFSGQSQQRQLGYSHALADAGLPVDPGLQIDGDFTQVCGFQAVRQLLALAEPPSAIFAANDQMAFGAMDALKARGLRIPEDISVIGFDDIPAASAVYPQLTTVRQPLQEMTDAAIRLLQARIEGQPMESQRLEFPSTLVIRASTGPAPGFAATAPMASG